MRGLFVGGPVDNSELDLEGTQPPLRYPPEGGSGQSRYRLSRIGHQGDAVAYAVYAAPELDQDEVARISDERGYARRFEAQESAAAA